MAKFEKISVYIICICLTLISVLCFNHLDLEYISTWGVSLLEHLQDTNLRNYAIDLFEMDYGTNYNLFQNMNVAIWCVVPYLISKVFLVAVPMFFYQTWIKLIIAILHVCCACELYKIIKLMGFDERKAFISAILYYASPIIMIHAIGIGQIDGLGILFFLLSVRMYIQKKYWYMSIAAGFALLSKFFVVFIYVPWLLLNSSKIRNMAKYLLVAIGIPLSDKIVTLLLIDKYDLQSSVHYKDSFLPRLFAVSINYESLFLLLILIICGICLLIGNRGEIKSYYYMLFPTTLFFVFFLLVFWHPQWSLYVFPLIIIMGCYISSEWEYLLFYSGYIYGFSIYSLVKCNTSWFNAIIIKNSLLGQVFRNKQTYIGSWIEENISPYLGELGYTVFMASFLMLIVVYYLNVSKRMINESKQGTVSNVIWYVVFFINVFIYFMILFLKYFGWIN